MSDPHKVVPVPADELARLLAVNAELVEALNWFIEDRRDEYRHLDRGISVSTKRGQSLLKARAALAKAESK